MSAPNKQSAIGSVISYIWIASTITIAWAFFTLLNRTIIHGKKNVPMKKDLLLLPNHNTMIDSFVVGTKLFYPRTLLRPELIPYHPAAEENFFNIYSTSKEELSDKAKISDKQADLIKEQINKIYDMIVNKIYKI